MIAQHYLNGQFFSEVLPLIPFQLMKLDQDRE